MVSDPSGMVRLPLRLQRSSATTRYAFPIRLSILLFSLPTSPQWFGTYNFLQDHIPEPEGIFAQLFRQAFIGFCASVLSDTVSNSLRVVKTYRQVNERRVGYMEAAEAVIATDGLRGLFGRGLKTRILANGLQGLMFSVLWKLFLKMSVHSHSYCHWDVLTYAFNRWDDQTKK